MSRLARQHGVDKPEEKTSITTTTRGSGDPQGEWGPSRGSGDTRRRESVSPEKSAAMALRGWRDGDVSLSHDHVSLLSRVASSGGTTRTKLGGLGEQRRPGPHAPAAAGSGIQTSENVSCSLQFLEKFQACGAKRRTSRQMAHGTTKKRIGEMHSHSRENKHSQVSHPPPSPATGTGAHNTLNTKY